MRRNARRIILFFKNNARKKHVVAGIPPSPELPNYRITKQQYIMHRSTRKFAQIGITRIYDIQYCMGKEVIKPFLEKFMN